MKLLLQNRRILLAILGLASLLMAVGLSKLKVDFSFDSFNPPDEEEFLLYEAYRDTFGYADNTVQIAFRNEGASIFDREFLLEVDAIMEKIGALPHVDSVIRPKTIQVFERRPGAFLPTPRKIFDFEDSTGIESGRQTLLADTLLYAGLVSRDTQFFAAFAIIDPSILDSSIRDTIAAKIERILASAEIENQVSGIPLIRTQYVRRITRELFVFLGLSLVLIILILFLTYRSFWGIWVPMIAVLVSLVWCLGFMGWWGTPIDLMSELLPPIIFVVGMSDIIHLVTKYIEELKEGKDRESAMRITLSEIGMATLLTSVTTAIGFGSLLVSRMPPLKSFGMFAAAGVIFAYLISIILLPNILLRISPEKLMASRGVGNVKLIDRMLSAMGKWVKTYPWPIVSGFLVVVAISVWGMTQISFNTFLLDDISENDPIRQSLTFFEEKFYGMRPFEMGIQTRPGHEVTDLDVLQNLDKIEHFLRRETDMSPFFSPVTFVKTAHKANKFGRPNFYKLPPRQETVEEYFSSAIALGGTKVLNAFMTNDRRYARLSASMKDVGTDSFTVIRRNLADFIAHETDTTLFEYHLTGSAILNETNVDHLRFSLFSGLLVAFGLIGFLLALLFRSWKMLLVGVLVNMIPLLFTAGVMGFAGITLKASTSIIFLIAFGIAVDDTIHFLSRFRLEISEGKSVDEAIDATIQGTGKAIILTSLVLFAGFSILLVSDFGGTFSIGLFTALTLFTALLSDVLLLPVLIRWLGVGKGKV